MAVAPSMLAQALIRHDAKEYFAKHCDEIHKKWTSLLRKTTLPADATSFDNRVFNSLAALHDAIGDPDPSTARLAYLQLARVLSALKEKVKEDRRRGAPFGTQKDASIVIAIHSKATGKTKAAVQTTSRMAHRCAALGRDSLLLLTLSDHDRRVIKNTSVPIRRLEAVAGEITRIYPPELILALNSLSDDGARMADAACQLMLVKKMLA